MRPHLQGARILIEQRGGSVIMLVLLPTSFQGCGPTFQ
jgi:hypothetical protein